jgi:hypothetical protein
MMPSEAAGVLAYAAAFDKRTIGRADALAWAEVLDGLDPADCRAAIRAYYRTDATDPIAPGQIITRVRVMHRPEEDRARFEANGDLRLPEYDPDAAHAAYLEASAALASARAGKVPSAQQQTGADGADHD